MKRCPITYELIHDDEDYSQRGLRLLSPQLKSLSPLPLTAAEQRQEAVARVGKMSVQGVQTKLSAKLKVKEGRFEIVDHDGHYILKPPSDYFAELAENEAITMSLAATIAIDVPVHGLVYAKDGSMTYFIKRFDRVGHKQKLAMEDFAQLSQSSRDTKYNSSMEKVAEIVTQSGFCSFPRIEAVKLFKLTLFNFLVGNEDMHLKNFSLITRDRIVTLAPAYDLLNSTIAQAHSREEIALPLNGKKNNLRKKDLIDYFGRERLQLNTTVMNEVLQQIQTAWPRWVELINGSFLSKKMQSNYLDLLEERRQRLEIEIGKKPAL